MVKSDLTQPTAVNLESVNKAASVSNKYFGLSNKLLIGGLVGVVLLLVVYFLYIRKNKEEFSEEVKVIFYYADWCPHCKNMLPHWSKLPNKKEINGKQVVFVKKDCVADQETCQKEDIEGYPTVKCHFANGESQELQFERTTEGILNAVGKLLGA